MYLDANFFIFVSSLTDKQGVQAREILKTIMAGKRAVSSVLAIDEVMWVIYKNRQQDKLRTIIENIYSIQNLTVKEVSPAIPLKALHFIEKCGLKPRDAFHAAIMEELGETEIVSDDIDFDNIPGITRIKL